ncbi:MAG: hypothetical protein WBO57_05120 [Gammaproteobacteria bacterium]
MRTLTPLTGLFGLALMLASGAGTQAQDAAASTPLEALADAGIEIVISDSNMINILVDVDAQSGDDGSDGSVTNFTVGTGPGSELPGGGMIAAPQGNQMSTAAVSDGGAKMLTIQELNTAGTADALTLNNGPETTYVTGSVTVNDESFHAGVNSMTVSSDPTNANISTTSISMYVTMSME